MRQARLRAGWSQQRLAVAAGVTRQTVAGIESGGYGPSTTVALKLAGALGLKVDDLFWLASTPEVAAAWAVSTPTDALPAARTMRVRLADVGGKLWAWPIATGRSLSTAADGLVATAGADVGCGADGRAEPQAFPVRLLGPRTLLRNTVVVVGCEPALELLAHHAFAARPVATGRALWAEMPNAAAMAAVAAGRAHVAALHGVDEPGRAMDLGLERPVEVPNECRVFHLARSRQGWIFPRRLPFRGAADLAGGTLRLVNRQPGSGARALLDRALRAAGIAPSAVCGYAQVAAGHAELAADIAAGAADIGVGAESVAAAHGLAFLPLREERCELWVPRAYCELPAVAELLSALAGGAFRADLTAAAPYDTADTGTERM